MTKKMQTGVSLEQEQADALDAIARRMKVSRNWVIRDAIDHYLYDHDADQDALKRLRKEGTE